MTDPKLKNVIRFLFDNRIQLTQSGSNEWKFSATRNVTGLDTTRVYATYDDAIEAVVHVAEAAQGKAA